MGKNLLGKTLLIALVVVILGLSMKVDSYASDNEAVTSITDDRTFTASEVLEITEDEVPLGNLSKHTRISWWWLSVVIVLGCAGAELISRREINKAKNKDKFGESEILR